MSSRWPHLEHAATAVTEQDMIELGEEISAEVHAGAVVVLDGPMGAGKTTFARGFARGLGVVGRVSSPTFVIARHHQSTQPGRPGLIHMDAYRLFGSDVAARPDSAKAAEQVYDQFEALDIDTDLADHVVLAEWGAGVVEQLAPRFMVVEISVSTADEVRQVRWGWLEHDQSR